MAELLSGAAFLILASAALGLAIVLRRRPAIEAMMAVQLAGTAGAAVALLLGAATRTAAATDIALLLALLAAFSCTAFALGEPDEPREDEP